MKQRVRKFAGAAFMVATGCGTLFPENSGEGELNCAY